jgi:DNA (cytosine-5)-methyltransferase 1
MWKHMARIIGEVRPQYAFVENSPMLTTRGLGVVLADLSSMGFDAKWGVVSAADVGANHQRERIWVRAEQKRNVAYTSSKRLQRFGNARINAKSISKQRFSWGGFDSGSNAWWEVEPNISRVANGVAARVDRLKAIGNGQVPLCAATAWELLK